MEEIKNKYIFPNFLAKAMAKIDMRTQYEASMMSMSLMLIGMMITITYLVIYLEFPLWYRIMLAINGVAAFIFMSGFLTTTFIQYQTYMEAIDFQKEIEELKGGPEKNG